MPGLSIFQHLHFAASLHLPASMHLLDDDVDDDNDDNNNLKKDENKQKTHPQNIAIVDFFVFTFSCHASFCSSSLPFS